MVNKNLLSEYDIDFLSLQFYTTYKSFSVQATRNLTSHQLFIKFSNRTSSLNNISNISFIIDSIKILSIYFYFYLYLNCKQYIYLSNLIQVLGIYY